MKKRMVTLILALCLVVSAVAVPLDSEPFAPQRDYETGHFSDVTSNQWYYSSVVSAYELGLMQGASSGLFRPEGSLSLAEALTLACRIHSTYHGLSLMQGAGAVWYQSYVDYADRYGLLPEDMVIDESAATRAQFARLLAAALPQDALSVIADIPDGSIPDVAESHRDAESIYALYRAGVLTGNDYVGTFTPDAALQRCEAAAVITRMALPQSRREFSLAAPLAGQLSDTLAWSLVGNTLSITGTGAIPDRTEEDECLWADDIQRIVRLEVSEGVTAVGKYAFAALSSLTELHLPATVTLVDNGAFAGVPSLTHLALPEGVQVVGYGAFENSYLQRIDLPASLTWIGGDAFASSDGDTVVYVAGNAPTLADSGVFGRGTTPAQRATLYRYDTTYGWIAPAYGDYQISVRLSGQDSYKPAVDATGAHNIVSYSNQALQHISQAGELLVASAQASDDLTAVQQLAAARNQFVAAYADLESSNLSCSRYRGTGALRACQESVMAQLATMKDISFTTETYLPHLNDFVARYLELGDELTAMGSQLRQIAA